MPKLLRMLLLILGLVLPVAACQFGGLSAQQDADLRAVYEKMRVNDLSGIEAQFNPQFKRPNLHQGLDFMQGMIPPQTPKVRVLKGVSEGGPGGSTDYGAIFEYDYPSTAVLADIRMRQDKAGRKTITGLVLSQQKINIADDYGFSLVGKKSYQYLFLVLVVLAPGFGIWGLYALSKATDLKWKFLWAIAMLIGFMDLKMDWTTGDVLLTIPYVHPLWLYASKYGPLSPWMISTSIPGAAIAFLLGYRRLERPWDPPKAPKPPKAKR